MPSSLLIPPQDEPIIVSDKSEQKEEVAKDKDIHASSHDVPKDTSIPHPPSLKLAQIQELKAQARPLYPDINQLTDLLVTSLKPEFSKLLASHNFSSCLPTEMKEFPSKFNELSSDVKELTKHVRDMEIELHGDIKEIPTKLETFTSTISNLTSKVAELKNIQWTSKAGVSKLLQLATMVENASRATTKDVPLAGQATVSPAKGDVEKKKSSKIINCDVITQKGPISLKVYREDGTIEVIANFKVSDLHLAEWRELLISQDLVHIAVNFLAVINDYKSVEQRFLDEYKENLEIQTELDKKNMTEMAVYRNDVPDLKIGKNVVENVQNIHNSNVVTSKVYKLDLQPLSPLVKHNKDAYVNYLKHTQENVDILREIVEHARELRPLDSDFAYACTFVTQIQELLVYVSVTCPSTRPVSDKLVVVTPMNRTRKVRFAESIDTSKDKIQKQVQLWDKQTTNNSVSPSTGVSSSTEASGLKPRSNTKKDRIIQTSSSNKKTNKVEDQPRIAKSSVNNLNRVSKIVCNANVKHYVLNTNSELICATCHECMFDAIHDLCVRDYLVDVNARVKSQYVKSKNAKSTKKRMWKPTGKVYTNVGYRFGNNQIAKIMGYGDYETGNVTISRVYYVEGLGHKLFSVGQFCYNGNS
ncbi:hypothetical protein Tco_0240558 [Tanacetum coccineum]